MQATEYNTSLFIMTSAGVSLFMTITIDDVHKVAHLARIKISPHKACHYLKNLQDILNLVNQMKSVDTTAIQPVVTHSLNITPHLRPDKVTETVQRNNLQKLTKHTQAGFYCVPPIIE